MKKILLTTLLLTSWCLHADGPQNPQEDMRECFDTCLAFYEPGYELRACVAKCQDLYSGDELTGDEKYCNSYEEGCDRDGDDPYGGL